MFDMLVPFTAGLLGSLHCVGMCGPLVIACSLRFKTAAPGEDAVSRFSSMELFHHLLFHAGRIFTYGVLGAVAAGFFYSIEVQRFAMLYRGWFMSLAGLTLIALGLALLGVLPVPALVTRLSSPGRLGRKIAGLANSTSPASRAALGLAAGLLPCGLTWAMLVTAATTLNPARGFITMASFGLGTVPMLLLTGISAFFLSARARVLGEKAAAFLVTLMGIIVLGKGGAVLFGFSGHCL